MIMNIIRDKIHDHKILDSEIIQDLKYERNNNLEFNINWIDRSPNWLGFSLLMHAVRSDREELVGYLLSIPGININYTTRTANTTALHLTKSVPVLKLLLSRRDININIENIRGYTALDVAINRKRHDIVDVMCIFFGDTQK